MRLGGCWRGLGGGGGFRWLVLRVCEWALGVLCSVRGGPEMAADFVKASKISFHSDKF
jgi:hypothetical protein